MKKVLLIVLILTGYAVGQATTKASAPKTPQAPPKPSTEEADHVGRYQLFFSPHARADVYLVDTETGRIWKPMIVNNASDDNFKTPPEVWVYQYRIDSGTDFDVWMGLHQPPAKTTTTTPTSPQ